MIDTQTKCINQNCKSLIFKTELIEHSSDYALYKNYICRCKNCKTIIAVLPYYRTDIIVNKIEEDIEKSWGETNSSLYELQQDIKKIKYHLNIF